MNPGDYDYLAAGFDSFLSRSIDDLSQTNLDAAGPRSNQMRFDSAQVSGSLGDVLAVGRQVFINGREGGIELGEPGQRELLIGTDSNGNQVVKIAKDGKDAKTARNDELIFNSQQNTLKIVSEGTGRVVSSGSPTNWVTIPHNLGFAPIPLAFLNNTTTTGITSNGNVPLPTYGSASIDVGNQQVIFRTWLYAIADDINFYVVLFNSTGAAVSLGFKYYLLQESASSEQ